MVSVTEVRIAVCGVGYPKVKWETQRRGEEPDVLGEFLEFPLEQAEQHVHKGLAQRRVVLNLERLLGVRQGLLGLG